VKFSESGDQKTEATAERDGTIAACFLGGIFAIVSLGCIAWNRKTLVMTFAFLTCIWSAAAIGAFTRLKTQTLDLQGDGTWSFTYGYFLAILSGLFRYHNLNFIFSIIILFFKE
jgi:hypothetical protein